jgi:quercetin 2,3-dioxygenase
MKTVVDKAGSRGGGDYGWLSTRHSFSFANWYDPARMGFGVLRVLNDDVIAPSTGFGMHSHRDMEIITIVTSGTVSHADSMGNKEEVPEGDVQVMSAGTGVTHSEQNLSPDKPLKLFQIWIEPNKKNIEPRYKQKSFNLKDSTDLTLLAAPTESHGALRIQQEAYLSYAAVDGTLEYTLKNPTNGVYIFVIKGNLFVADQVLGTRDAVGITETNKITLSSKGYTSILLVEVPMHQ